MHILYIEDDLVDQMMFKRLCKEIEGEVSYQITNSIEELKELASEKSFDLIFSDIFLPDGDINNVLELLKGQEVIIVSGETSPEFLKTFINHEYSTVYDKPMTLENILEAIEKKGACEAPSPREKRSLSAGEFKAIKLANLERLSKGDPEDMIELMDIALDVLPQRMQELARGFEEKNWGQVHFSAHAAKGVSRLVGIPVYDELGELDRKARMEVPDPEELFNIYENLLPVMKLAYEELTQLKACMKA